MSNRPLRWLELAVPAHAEAVEAVSEILDRVGYNGIAVEQPLEPGDGADHVVKAYVVYDPAARIRVRRVREALGHLQAFGLGPIGALSVRRIEDEDWLEAWKASVTPVRAGPFLVLPTWSDADAGDALVLSLDPGMAFGTGLHPTTQQCLERIGALDLAGRALLDVGTGSGILAIAGAKRGAARVVGVDDDAVAVRAAVENVARNTVAVEIALGSAADVPGTFDVVVANIVASVLVALAPALRARLAPGGALLLAGITLGCEADVVAAFRAAGLAAAERGRRDDWVSLVLR